MAQNKTELLEQITALSHAFGTTDYVRGGGGNTSVKTAETLWVKPSGTTLAGLAPEAFVALDRQKLAALYAIRPPEDASAREAVVKEVMGQAVLAGSRGRASVEAPLHDSLAATFVVHTHPALVNGMTCSRDGKVACAELFPEALWLDYIDPGYTLCMQVRQEIGRFENETGRQPEMIFLKNHGVFVAGDSPQAIRQSYQTMITTLQDVYAHKGIATDIAIGPAPDAAQQAAAADMIRKAFNDPSLYAAGSGVFALAEGPVSPDHIVYAKSYYLTAEPTRGNVADFEQQHGYKPHIVAWDAGVWGVGATENKAALALELAQDAGLVCQLANAFGGIDLMSDRARAFIENWEVESYRSRQV